MDRSSVFPSKLIQLTGGHLLLLTFLRPANQFSHNLKLSSFSGSLSMGLRLRILPRSFLGTPPTTFLPPPIFDFNLASA